MQKWIPAAKEQWVMVITTVEPHVQLLTKKTKEVYSQSKEVVTPHVIKIKETVHPHFQVYLLFSMMRVLSSFAPKIQLLSHWSNAYQT